MLVRVREKVGYAGRGGIQDDDRGFRREVKEDGGNGREGKEERR